MKFDFKNKNILITGASRGIGKSIAKEFYKLGANILGTSTTKSLKKNRFELIKVNFFDKKELKFFFDYLKNKKIDIFFIKILDEFINVVKKDDKKIYIVFNAVNPDILYPDNKNNHKLKDLLLNKKLKQLKKYLSKNNIAFYDFNEYLLKNYNKENINTMFKKINGHWDHYTEKGFFKIVEQVNKNLIN